MSTHKRMCEGRSPGTPCPSDAAAEWVVTVDGPAVTGPCPVWVCDACSHGPFEGCGGGLLIEKYRSHLPRPLPVMIPAQHGVTEKTWTRLFS
jgi:hypothetical protein